MLNLQEELNKLFVFERNISPIWKHLENTFTSQQGVSYANVLVRSEYYDIVGTAHHLHTDRGLVIYEYVVYKELGRKGPKLPGELSIFQDCAFQYHGLKLNCLAEMYGGPVRSLIIRDMYNGESIPVMHRPAIAKLFLKYLTQQDPAIVPIAKPKESQTKLFAA
jgi:hypothetical protein